MFLILASTIISILVYILLIKPHKYWEQKRVKYILPTTIFGNVAEFLFQINPISWIIHEMYREYPEEKYIGIFEYYCPILMLKDIDLIRDLVEKNKVSLKRRMNIWKRGHRVVDDNFHPRNIVETFNKTNKTVFKAACLILNKKCADLVETFSKTGELVEADMKANLKTYRSTIFEGKLLQKKVGKTHNYYENVDDTVQKILYFLGKCDVTSIVMCHLFYELMLNQNIQKRVLEEIQEEKNSIVSFESISSMTYLNSVVLETLRKWPPIPFTDRKSITKVDLPRNGPGNQSLHLTPRSVFWIPIYPIHRSEKYHLHPDDFQPERFYKKADGCPDGFLPFGVGKMSCPGSELAVLEIKILIYNFLKHFEIVPCSKTRIPFAFVFGDFNILPETCHVGLLPRKK